MHMLGEPRTMQDDPRYDDVVDDVRAFLEERVEFAVREGVREERIMVDPGIGFGKTLEHNLELLRRLDRIATHRAAGRHRDLAQVVPRAPDRAARTRTIASPRRWRRPCSRSSAARASSASTTSRPRGTPWRWRLLRCAPMAPEDDDLDDELEDDED